MSCDVGEATESFMRVFDQSRDPEIPITAISKVVKGKLLLRKKRKTDENEIKTQEVKIYTFKKWIWDFFVKFVCKISNN